MACLQLKLLPYLSALENATVFKCTLEMPRFYFTYCQDNGKVALS